MKAQFNQCSSLQIFDESINQVLESLCFLVCEGDVLVDRQSLGNAWERSRSISYTKPTSDSYIFKFGGIKLTEPLPRCNTEMLVPLAVLETLLTDEATLEANKLLIGGLHALHSLLKLLEQLLRLLRIVLVALLVLVVSVGMLMMVRMRLVLLLVFLDPCCCMALTHLHPATRGHAHTRRFLRPTSTVLGA